jgi:hypothetical protein
MMPDLRINLDEGTMPKRFYDCAACPAGPPQGFNRPPGPQTMCAHCKKSVRTWTPVSDEDNRIWLQKRSFVTSVLNGTWPHANAGAATNGLPPAAGTEANLYKGKHFDLNKDKDSGKYIDLTRFQVKSMEDLAIAEGLSVPGAAIFFFNVIVGSDGSTFGDFTPNTHAIRVDSIGTTGQHSHPIPEDRCGKVNHRSLVSDAIITAHNNEDLFSLLKVAIYLNRIGAAHNSFSLNKDEKKRINKAKTERACVYWSW